MINIESGKVIDLTKENSPISGCTVSRQVYSHDTNGIFIFSLAPNTDISPESYEYHKLWIMHSDIGEMITTKNNAIKINSDCCILTPLTLPVGIKTDSGCVYTEISFGKECIMNEILKAGEVFKLAELLPYSEGKIVNMDLVKDTNMKLVLMSFDEGTGLSEHAAPGEALVFALEGKASIGYEGKEYEISAGETFKFDKMGKHSVKAKGRFKMALLLVL